ncbi:MAG: flippase [Acidimicrobiia bacterium]|nr:flippase [Acidimicrobiia bacterium]
MSNKQIGDAKTSVSETDDSESHSQVRGSSLLLSGQLVATAISYATQILIIRYLSKSDYGAFAYALSIVAVLQAAVQFGFDRGLSRYLPIYDEKSDTGSIIGAITFVGGMAAGFGSVAAVVFWTTRSLIEGALIEDPLAVSVLAILVVLAPVDALDNLLITILAAFRRTGAIFLRRYVVAPLLKFATVVLLIGTGSNVKFLAVGYATAGFIGLVVFASVLGRYLSLRRSKDPMSPIRFPIRELATFSLPLLTTDLVFMVFNASDSIMLEWFGSTVDVATLRAVQPTARLNQLVLSAFGVLYIPYIARLFARGEHDEVGRRYWQTVNWVVMLSLPVLSLCLLFPNELTGRLLGGDYADSAAVLGVLAVGYFIHAMFGFNGMTLNVYRKIGYLVGVNLAAVSVNVALNLALIPSMGPLGAAIGTTGSFLFHNIAKQYGLIRRVGLSRASSSTWRLYALVIGVATTSAVVGYGSGIPFWGRVGLWAAFGAIAILVGRKILRIDEAFPGLARIPLIRRIFR